MTTHLDLDSAIARVRYVVEGVTFTREVFASAPDQVIVVRITADRPGKVSLQARWTSPHAAAKEGEPPARVRIAAVAKDQLALRGQLGKFFHRGLKQEVDNALRFEARLRLSAEGGAVRADDQRLAVDNADAATLLIAAATSYKNFQDVSADPAQRCDRTMGDAGAKTFVALQAGHVADHRRLFRRVGLDLGAGERSQLPTDERIRGFAPGGDPQLAALFFQFGRYLLIASSRPGGQPANLQGLWNESLNPPWDSKWTTNINTQMNYWPAEVCNLAECHAPLFDMIDDLVVSGRKTAQAHYGCRGWVLHHNTDLWRGTAPINHANHGIWPTGGAWLTRHLWEHYLYGGDRDFLARRAYPVMKEAALFFTEFLVKDPKSGRLVSTPSNSPEQGGLVAGPAMDHQIIRELFGHVIEASTVLGVDADFRARLADMRRQIAPDHIGRLGQLQEWLEDRDDARNHHRHVSHMYAVYPGCEITPRRTPELAAAARKSLEMRGDAGTGWSLAWKVNLWTRLGNGDRSYKLLAMMLTPGRTYPNLFDAHPPFQIDGNFGAAAGIAEMLLQSHAGEVAILPALPAPFSSGQVRGLRARGGLEVDIAWRDGRPVAATLKALRDGQHRLRLPARAAIAAVHSAGRDLPVPTETGTLDVKAGQTYDLKFR